MEIQIQDSKRGMEILKLMHIIENMKGYKINFELLSLNTSIHIFDWNFIDLRTIIQNLVGNPNADVLFMPRNRESLYKVSLEIVRKFHNFVSAVASLRDHQRMQYQKHYQKQGLMPEYEQRKNVAFVNNTNSSFIQSLRDYLVHDKIPGLHFLGKYDQASTRVLRRVAFGREDLLENKKWNSSEKEYLIQFGEGVDILEIAEKYHQTALAFTTWFQTQQDQIHKQDILEFRKTEAKLLRLQLLEKLERCLELKDERHCYEGNLFSNVLLDRDFQLLAALPTDSKIRSEKAIELVGRVVEVDDTIRQLISTVYEQEKIGFLQLRDNAEQEIIKYTFE